MIDAACSCSLVLLAQTFEQRGFIENSTAGVSADARQTTAARVVDADFCFARRHLTSSRRG